MNGRVSQMTLLSVIFVSVSTIKDGGSELVQIKTVQMAQMVVNKLATMVNIATEELKQHFDQEIIVVAWW